MNFTFGSLFAGIGGFDLGFERAGFRCAWQVEINEFCRKVLAKHWPDVRRHDDVRTFPPTDPGEWGVDVICGGFPCQDISIASGSAGGAGIDGERSGLWREFARIIRVVRPRFVIVENSPAITVRGMGRVLGDLAAIGFDAEWSMLSACRMGAPHTRDRMFIVAYPDPTRWSAPRAGEGQAGATGIAGRGRSQRASPRMHQADGIEHGSSWWACESTVDRMAYGVSSDVDRLAAMGLGNAVVPQVAEWIARRLMAVMTEHPHEDET